MRLKVLFTFLVFSVFWWILTSTWNTILKSDNTPISATKVGLDFTEVDAIVEEVFRKNGIEIPTVGSSTLPTLEDDSLQTLMDDLQRNQLEVYLLESNNLNQLRIYDRTSLRYAIEIPYKKSTIPMSLELIEDSRFSNSTTKIAIVITGLENKKIDPILDLDVPLNLVLNPESPFALYNAVNGAKSWHEIVLDVTTSDFFSLESLPMVSAIWTVDEIPLPYGVISLGPNSTFPLDITQSNPFTRDRKIYTSNVQTVPLETLKEWIRLLPDNVELVRLSHWSIVSSQENRP